MSSLEILVQRHDNSTASDVHVSWIIDTHVGGMHYVRFYYWREFNLPIFFAIHQTANLKSTPNFPAIWYVDMQHAEVR